MRARAWTVLGVAIALCSGCNPMEALHSKIRNAGYIVFRTPLSHSGPGTLVGGAPSRLSLVAPPHACFPRQIDGVDTELVHIDETALPERRHKVTASGKAKVGLADFLSTGNPVLGGGLKFNHVETVEMRMEGVHVEYLDAIKLMSFYREQMSEPCKQFLDKVGFIVQAIKVERLEFNFYRKNGAGIELTLENLKSIVDLSVGIDFEIEDQVTLVINSPKYIGYQLGRLRYEDGGMAIYRASRVKNNKFQFDTLDLFESKFDRLRILPAALSVESIDDHAIFY